MATSTVTKTKRSATTKSTARTYKLGANQKRLRDALMRMKAKAPFTLVQIKETAKKLGLSPGYAEALVKAMIESKWMKRNVGNKYGFGDGKIVD